MISHFIVHEDWLGLLTYLLRIGSCLFLVHTISIIIYRLTLHPLAKYPGPFLAKITNLDNIFRTYKRERHTNFLECHQRYGPVYRYGPNQLCFNTSDALHDIYGAKSNVQKASFYISFSPGLPSTFNVVDKKVHAFKRRTISHAFSEKALKSMEQYVIANIEKWHDSIKSRAKMEIFNMSTWSTYLTFDVMGELAFGRSFDMTNDEENRPIADAMTQSAYVAVVNGVASTMSWLGLATLLVPARTAEKREMFRRYAIKQATERAGAGAHTDRKDFFHYLIEARDPETGEGLQANEMQGESSSFIVAGSDTTSTVLAGTFFYLLHNPLVLDRVTKEVRDVFKDHVAGDIQSGPELSSCIYLRACLDETMRLAPPVPGALPREVSIGGETVDGHYIPEGTEVNVSPFAIHRNAEYYDSPLQYKPERWLSNEQWADGVSKSDVEKARHAFCAFSIGPRACIGRSMAYLELTLAMARILFSFNLELAGSENDTGEGKLWPIADCFVATKDGPMVRFLERKDM